MKGRGKAGAKPKTKPEPPPDSEKDYFKSVLPDLNDGGRWTVENQGNGWKFRRLFNDGRPSRYYGSLLWRTWAIYKEKYSDDQIKLILAGKIARKQREIERAA